MEEAVIVVGQSEGAELSVVVTEPLWNAHQRPGSAVLWRRETVFIPHLHRAVHSQRGAMAHSLTAGSTGIWTAEMDFAEKHKAGQMAQEQDT